MTTAQANALIRATEYNIRILAKGVIRASGQRFFLTSSRDGRGQHVVLVDEQTAQMVSERQARLNYEEQQRDAWAESVNWCA